MKKNIIYFCVIFLFIKSHSYAQSYQFKPIDESKKDKSLMAFTAKLKKAVENKSERELIALLDKNVNLSFGGDHGINDFKKMWHPEKSTSELWPLLKKMIDLGGVFIDKENSSFVYPYIFNIKLPNDTMDVFSSYVAIGEKVFVYKTPSLKGSYISALSYDLITGQDNGKGWTFIQTLDKKIKG